MNLRTFDTYYHAQMDLDASPSITFEHIKLDLELNNDLIIINNLLSDTECDRIISKSTNLYQTLDKEYLPSQRDSLRFLNMDQSTANIIYDRLKLPIKNLDSKIKPFGFGTDGLWLPRGINPCFRHCLYLPGSVGFAPHRDASFIETSERRSIHTIIIYLTDDFDEGYTTFIKSKLPRQLKQTVAEELVAGSDIIYKYKPKKGSALIFNHNVIHSGTNVETKPKYIIRSDIIYERDLSTKPLIDTWSDSELFLEAIEYYREANNQETDGNVELVGELYERGLALRQFNN